MRFEDDQPASHLIPLTPLIDVVFILLVFFMLASSFLDWRAVDLRLAGAAGEVSAEGEVLLVGIRADGSYRLNGEAVTLAELEDRVANRIAEMESLPVLVQPESGVTLQSAVDMLDFLKGAGAANVSLSRER